MAQHKVFSEGAMRHPVRASGSLRKPRHNRPNSVALSRSQHVTLSDKPAVRPVSQGVAKPITRKSRIWRAAVSIALLGASWSCYKKASTSPVPLATSVKPGRGRGRGCV